MAKKKKKIKKEAVQVDAHLEADRPVTLTEGGQDRFTRTTKWVVDASKLGISVETWRRELFELLMTVEKWLKNHESEVLICYAAERDNQIGIYFVPTLGRYDFELSNLLTKLDIELAEKHQKCQCDLFQQPESDAKERLIALGSEAVLLHGEDRKSQSQMVA